MTSPQLEITAPYFNLRDMCFYNYSMEAYWSQKEQENLFNTLSHANN